MAEKRMFILPAELIEKIDDNRGDMSRVDFINFLIDNQLKKENEDQKYASKEELYSFEQDIKKLVKTSLDFFVSYGLEMGKESPKAELKELTSQLHTLQKDLESEGEEKKGTIRWK
jgi:hypothetical protein